MNLVFFNEKGGIVVYEQKYNEWLEKDSLDEELKAELSVMSDTEKKDAFYKDLEFGTGGMRGIIGAGTNRMNVYTLRKANVGFGLYLKKQYPNAISRRVVIAHDNRHKSREFAEESAKVLGTFGIKCYLFDDLRATPELSFAVRHLNAIGGIVVTASHNPPNYNGYKIYDENGCQLTPKYADQVIDFVNQVEDVFAIETMNIEQMKKQELFEIIGESIDRAYLDALDSVLFEDEKEKNIKLIFTPLHGASAEIGLAALKRHHFDVVAVKEQMVHDPNFTTVSSPNPENKEAFALALEYGKKHDADLLIATDPDGDRLGIAVKHDGDYKFLTGNQTGAVMIEYIVRKKKENHTLPKKGMIYNTIVTSDFGAVIARSYGLSVVSTLTGFKFIGEQAKLIEDTDQEFVFGYEESYGYVVKDFVRDKDSIQALLLISEIANELKAQGKTIYDQLLNLYAEYGYYLEDLVNIVLEGAEGERKIKEIIEFFRKEKPSQFSHKKLVRFEDYKEQKAYTGDQVEELTLPKSNVLKFIFDDDSWFVCRPSGTEPKLKIYIGVIGESLADAKAKNEAFKKEIMKLVEQI
jgi:phosphoglucomutase